MQRSGGDKTNTMTQDITDKHVKMIRAIEAIITLQNNVNNGCEFDEAELEKQLPRLNAMKSWAIENGTLQNVLSWIRSRQSAWGLDSRKFIANDYANFFAA